MALLNRMLFALVFVFSLAGSFYRLDEYPARFDYDFATEAIFVNNYNFQDRYDHYFSSPPADGDERQNRYLATYAAHRLPLTIPLAWIQRAVGGKPYDVERLVKLLASTVAVLAAALIALNLIGDRISGCFFVGALCVHPAFFLMIRTGALYWLIFLLVYWLTIVLTLWYCRTSKSRYIYAAAFGLAYLAMNPYPPLLVLPYILVTILLIERRLRRALADRHVYLAGILSLALFTGGIYAVAVTQEDSLHAYLEKVAEFRARRGGVLSVGQQLLKTEASERLTKLVNQHLLFRRDDTGDRSRTDFLWTLGEPHYPLLLTSPLMLLGLVSGLRRRDPTTLIFAGVLFWIYALSLTLSFPEGRFILVAVPCYVYFTTDFIRTAVRNQERRIAAFAVLLLALSGYTYYVVMGSYSQDIERRLQSVEGMREIAMHLPPRRAGVDRYISLPIPHSYHAWLHYVMVTNFGPEWLQPPDFEREFEERRRSTGKGRAEFFYVAPALSAEQIEKLRGSGFRRIARFETPHRGLPMTIMRAEIGGR